MKITILLAHPDKNSFNHAIALAVTETLKANGYEINYHDLYDENFPAILPANEIPRDVPLPSAIKKHCDELAQAAGIIIIHPNWWGQPPAILKGWIDRILRPGVAYKFAEGDLGDGELVGLLKAETVLIFNTSNTPPERESNLYGNPLELLWKNNMLLSCGAKNYHRKNFGIIITSTMEQRKAWLVEAGEITDKYFPRRN